jgi:hypothetical protein
MRMTGTAVAAAAMTGGGTNSTTAAPFLAVKDGQKVLLRIGLDMTAWRI